MPDCFPVSDLIMLGVPNEKLIVVLSARYITLLGWKFYLKLKRVISMLSADTTFNASFFLRTHISWTDRANAARKHEFIRLTSMAKSAIDYCALVR